MVYEDWLRDRQVCGSLIIYPEDMKFSFSELSHSKVEFHLKWDEECPFTFIRLYRGLLITPIITFDGEGKEILCKMMTSLSRKFTNMNDRIEALKEELRKHLTFEEKDKSHADAIILSMAAIIATGWKMIKKTNAKSSDQKDGVNKKFAVIFPAEDVVRGSIVAWKDGFPDAEISVTSFGV